jgi:hypothetical protein
VSSNSDANKSDENDDRLAYVDHQEKETNVEIFEAPKPKTSKATTSKKFVSSPPMKRSAIPPKTLPLRSISHQPSSSTPTQAQTPIVHKFLRSSSPSKIPMSTKTPDSTKPRRSVVHHSPLPSPKPIRRSLSERRIPTTSAKSLQQQQHHSSSSTRLSRRNTSIESQNPIPKTPTSNEPPPKTPVSENPKTPSLDHPKTPISNGIKTSPSSDPLLSGEFDPEDIIPSFGKGSIIKHSPIFIR